MIPTYIILHHSLTKDSETVSWGAIKKYHTKELGWKDIGYHFGIELIDNEYQILFGRMPNKHGAHCSQFGMNGMSLGICFVGNFDLHKPDPSLWNKGLELVRWLKEVYKIPTENVYGHRDYANYKSCPGKFFDMNTFRRDL
jgi:N-acetylmuramoyl-L-alanine amidase